MNLNDYGEEVKRSVAEFKQYWADGQKKDGKENWPDEMLPGVWDEHFSSFLSHRV